MPHWTPELKLGLFGREVGFEINIAAYAWSAKKEKFRIPELDAEKATS